jgi:hypothetical protein
MTKSPITLRNNTYYIRRRVPKRYALVEDRSMVHLSLHTDSQSVAEGKWRAIRDNQVEAWEAKLAGDTADAEKRDAAARELVAAKEKVRKVEQKLQRNHIGRLREGLAESIETSNIHQETLRALKQINTAFCMVGYPILLKSGDLLKSRLA